MEAVSSTAPSAWIYVDASASDEILSSLVVIAATAITITGLLVINARLKQTNQGFGPNSLQAFGAVIFLPMVLALAAFSDFSSEVLAALLGTLAGYIFSRAKGDDK
ncbi:MAG: hypothetical protein ACU0DT_18795 [Albimonas sp.]|uniref:hypothetical protein n=1 Tax=Albimonas sp. TaxID=1872425 RepID=UPI0040571973